MELEQTIAGAADGQSELNAGLAVKLRAMGDNAYCAYIEQMRNQLCLGWERKVKNGEFTRDNLDAFMRAAEWLGRHKALHEASNMTAND